MAIKRGFLSSLCLSVCVRMCDIIQSCFLENSPVLFFCRLNELGIIILLARDRIAKFRQDAFTAVGIYSLHPQHEPSLDPQGLVGPLQVLMGDNRARFLCMQRMRVFLQS